MVLLLERKQALIWINIMLNHWWKQIIEWLLSRKARCCCCHCCCCRCCHCCCCRCCHCCCCFCCRTISDFRKANKQRSMLLRGFIMPIIIIPSLASLPFTSATFSLLSPLEGNTSINVTSDHYMCVELLRFKQTSGFACCSLSQFNTEWSIWAKFTKPS